MTLVIKIAFHLRGSSPGGRQKPKVFVRFGEVRGGGTKVPVDMEEEPLIRPNQVSLSLSSMRDQDTATVTIRLNVIPWTSFMIIWRQ